jgi:hypothetical protein
MPTSDADRYAQLLQNLAVRIGAIREAIERTLPNAATLNAEFEIITSSVHLLPCNRVRGAATYERRTKDQRTALGIRDGAFPAARIRRPSIQYSGVVVAPGPNSWRPNISLSRSVPVHAVGPFALPSSVARLLYTAG